MRRLRISASRELELFPSISITGALGRASPELDDLFTSPAKIWSATGGILQPIFQGGRLRANVSRAEAVREQRKSEYARTVQQAFREVLDSLQGQALIAGVHEANDQQVAALSRATELAELRYAQGDLAYLDLLDVRRGLYQAQIDLVAAQRDALPQYDRPGARRGWRAGRSSRASDGASVKRRAVPPVLVP